MEHDFLEINDINKLNTILGSRGDYSNHIMSEAGIKENRDLKFFKVDFGDINLNNYKSRDLFFENCTGATIYVSSKTIFKNCKFQEIKTSEDCLSIKIIDCKVDYFTGALKSNIEGSEIKEIIVSTKKFQERSLSLQKSKITEQIKCQGGIVDISQIETTIEKIVFEDINSYLELDNFDIKNIEFIRVNEPKEGVNIKLSNIKSINTLSFYNSSINSLIIEQCLINKLLVDDIKECSNFDLKNSFVNEFLLKKYDIKRLTIDGNTNIVSFLWNLSSSKLKSLQLRSGDIDIFPLIHNLICFDGTIANDSEINFSDCGIGSIIFWKVSVQGKMTFSNVLGANWIVPTDYQEQKRNIDLNETIKIYKKNGLIPKDLKWHWGEIPTYAFFIIDSDLGKTNFNNCSFRDMDLYMQGVKTNDVNISDSLFPDKLYNPPKAPLGSYRIAYAQLRKMHENRGDSIKANMYQAHELDAYYQTLRWFNKNEFSEKLNLWLNRSTNYFGQDYVRAFGITIIFSVVLYSVYCLLLGFHLDISDDNAWKNFWNIAGNFLEFLNPIHKADFIAEALLGLKNPENIPSSARSWEVFSRILNGYFIYQFIQAFRKYGKK